MARLWIFILVTLIALPIALTLFAPIAPTARFAMTAVLAISAGGVAALLFGAAQAESDTRTRR